MKKLNKEHEQILLELGNTKEEIEQIEKALKFTVFELESGEIITAKEAEKLLGTSCFVSGMERSAFHCTTVRENKGIRVYFDSSKLFKQK